MSVATTKDNSLDSVEKAIEKIVTSAKVTGMIADRVSERIASKIEKTIERMYKTRNLAEPNHASTSGGGSEVPLTSITHYEYRTITQQEINSVMAALPGVKWNRCKRGHLYAVGECGNPAESGYCIECKTRLSR
ncbi:hypothetical protein LPJ55_000174 [Coemansia sp. RSA 990]|nr:hypothetical protein LPJ68_002628 [Coemansia sp. RSA 1086]KAJ1875994.1 hypothetical protein LPJ55_000174 [Coemansia sp. RSA 990]KAJ2652574.1 hypothetical protein IWW40_001060 [Coemansia sp. RSA 1250]KAJ2674105.1 hypothetical protein IWW42_001925 [Coemansia sp. RSA 1085]